MKYKRTLALNSDGSFRTENGSLVWIDGVDAVEQELKTTLLTVRGEDPFNEDHGLRTEKVAGSPPEVLEREIRNTLSQDDRVDSVDDVDIGEIGPDRRTSVAIRVSLVDGVGLDFSVEV